MHLPGDSVADRASQYPAACDGLQTPRERRTPDREPIFFLTGPCSIGLRRTRARTGPIRGGGQRVTLGDARPFVAKTGDRRHRDRIAADHVRRSARLPAGVCRPLHSVTPARRPPRPRSCGPPRPGGYLLPAVGQGMLLRGTELRACGRAAMGHFKSTPGKIEFNLVRCCAARTAQAATVPGGRRGDRARPP